ncbi:MAG: hypothetical protein JWM82_930 [Myxococcales bacterium]|nr:hypothetical protein [Myxococcales bacterium]
MKIRSAEVVRALLFGAACGLFAACGTHGKAATHDGAAGHDGGKDTSAEALDVGAAGADALEDGGAAGADVAADVATSPDGSDVGVGTDAANGASADATDAVEARAEIDAGSGCVAPAAQAALSPAAEGLPVDGLVLWVRGDRGVYKTAQNEVCAWRDQSAQDRLLIPGAGGRPAWESAGVGGQAAIHFITEGQDLYTPDVLGMSATSPRTFIAVSKLVNTAGRFHPILQGEGGTPGNYLGIDSNTWQTVGSLEGAYATVNSFDTTMPTSASARVHVLTVSTLMPGTVATAALDYRVNGTSKALTLKAGNGTIASFAGANFTTVGAVSGTPSAGAAGGNGLVAEAIIYNRALTVDERVAIETALKTRYGIQ